MSDGEDRDTGAGADGPSKDVDIAAWVEEARADPVLYERRQVTEILLASIGSAPALSTTLVLKGGTLMALAFRSERTTTDVDFTALADPAGFEAVLRRELDERMPAVAPVLGYVDLVCKVQSVKRKPRPQTFENANFPALQITIGWARRGKPKEERRLAEGAAARVLAVDVSFRDPVYHTQALNLAQPGVSVLAFTLQEQIAEKLRATLEQPVRDRVRRQDVFDVSYLLDGHELEASDRRLILQTLRRKCVGRGFTLDAGSIDVPQVAERARAEWHTLALEVKTLPAFDDCFGQVRALYASLPWEEPTLEAVHAGVHSLLDQIAVRGQVSPDQTRRLESLREDWAIAGGGAGGRDMLSRARGVVGMVGASEAGSPHHHKALIDLMAFKTDWLRLDLAER